VHLQINLSHRQRREQISQPQPRRELHAATDAPTASNLISKPNPLPVMFSRDYSIPTLMS
jgi:hypothetical protein